MSGITGLHHITALSSDPGMVVKFYVEVLGMRLLRKTVNPDQLSVLQFFCGDNQGSPGSIISFLFWKAADGGRLGTGQVTNITFSVPAGTHDFWLDRLIEHDVDIEGFAFAFGERQLLFRDPDGLPLALVEIPTEGSPAVLPAIACIRSVEIQVAGFEHMARFLKDFLGFQQGAKEHGACRFSKMSSSGSTIIDLVSAPTNEVGVSGPGTSHHVAWRVPDCATLNALCARLTADGFDVTPPLDRVCFRAAYFLAPGGVAFALATDGPGFPVLEADPGSSMPLSLPPWLEARRKMIEKSLLPWGEVPKLN